MDLGFRMIPESEGPTTAGSAHDSSDDTLELELTGELAGSRTGAAAGATARPHQSGQALSMPAYENFALRRTARIDFVCNVTLGVAVLGIAVASMWPSSDGQPRACAPTSATPLAVAAPGGTSAA